MRLLRVVARHHNAEGSALPTPSAPGEGQGMPGMWPVEMEDLAPAGLDRLPRLLWLRRMCQRIGRMVRRPIITIDIDDGIARVVIIEGREVVAWGTSVLGPEAGEEGSTPRDRGASRELRALLIHLPYHDGRVVTSLSSRASLVRRLELPRMNRRYLEQVVLSEVLDAIPFTKEEADIAWRHRKAGPGHHVVAVAVPKEAIDRHVALLKGARCRPVAAYPRALALAFAAGHPDVIVVDLGLFSATVVAVRAGIPLLVHQAEYPNDDRPRYKAEAVARTVEQAADHFHAAGAQAASGTDEEAQLPAVVTGQLANDPTLAVSIEALTGREAASYSPRFVYPEHFPAREYAANLGLAIADRSRPRARARPSISARASVNALPDRHLPPKLPILPGAVLALVVVLVYLAFVATGHVERMASGREALSSQVVAAERQARTHSLSLSKAASMERRIAEAIELQAVLESQMLALDAGMSTMATQLDSLTDEALPPGTKLLTLSLQGGKLFLTGTAPAFEGVVQYAERLRGSGSFAGVRVLRVDASGSGMASGTVADVGAGSVSYQIEVTMPLTPEED